MPASEAKGRNWLPGTSTAMARITGIRMTEQTSVVGCPMTSAGDMPICTFIPPNRFLATSCVFSAMGFRPSMNRLVIRGMSSITPPIVTPRNNTFLMSSWAAHPISTPTITPNTNGSPNTPNFFFSPSASISSFENPGILSSSQLMVTANTVKL